MTATTGIAAPASAATGPGVVVDYASTSVVQVKPREIRPHKDLFYADLTWTKLTPSTGAATGVRRINTCLPSCGDGNYKSDKVRLTFSRVRERVFTQVTVTAIGTGTVDSHPLPARGSSTP
ncbi:hypothetical protein [Actinoplanes rectilineatus]|uniref:hypothetical protein n=1 Tax=Actinoplanes rectilineatus TaxID=113571 RepID=UPI0005F2EC64|nr:hypothetical protein [Actinoplanes rectilineatus]